MPLQVVVNLSTTCLSNELVGIHLNEQCTAKTLHRLVTHAPHSEHSFCSECVLAVVRFVTALQLHSRCRAGFFKHLWVLQGKLSYSLATAVRHLTPLHNQHLSAALIAAWCEFACTQHSIPKISIEENTQSKRKCRVFHSNFVYESSKIHSSDSVLPY